LIATGAALALAVALAAAGAGDAASVPAAASATPLVALALLTGQGGPVYAALLLLGATYVIPDGDRTIPAPLYAGALLLLAELAFWSLDEREPTRVEPGTVAPRLRGILGVVAAGIAAGALVLFASGPDTARSAGTTAAGVAAILVCIAVLAVLAGGGVSRHRA
jgi:hypothetical protein